MWSQEYPNFTSCGSCSSFTASTVLIPRRGSWLSQSGAHHTHLQAFPKSSFSGCNHTSNGSRTQSFAEDDTLVPILMHIAVIDHDLLLSTGLPSASCCPTKGVTCSQQIPQSFRQAATTAEYISAKSQLAMADLLGLQTGGGSPGHGHKHWS